MHVKFTCRKSVTSYRVCSRLISSGKDAYQTRDKRGRGVRRRVEADVRLPDSWGESLKEDSNKTELILYVRAHQVNGDGHNLSQMHGSLSGPHHLKHQQYARELVK
ncbi:hypothetical protein ACROYT_G005157 [Oculina patagonica]